MSKIIKDYTEGSLPKQMLAFSLPFMLSNALQVAYSIVDMIVVGNVLGSAGLSAVATAGQVVTFMTLICIGFSMGGQVLISQLIGAGKKEQLNSTVGTLFTLTTAIGIIATLTGLFFCRAILHLLKTPELSFEPAVDYLFISSAGMLFSYGYNMVSSVLRGMGNSKQPCLYIIIAGLTDIALDILFVVEFGWGTAGAALATVIGQGVSFLWSVVYLARNKKSFGFDFKLRSFLPERKAAAMLLKLGIPFALRSASVNLSMMYVTSLVNNVSVEASAVFGVGLKVNDTVDKISLGVNYSVSTVTGQNFAAGNIERTKKTVYWGFVYSFAIYAFFAAVFLINIEGMFRLFTREQGVLLLAPVFVHAVIWGFPAMSVMRATNGFIQGIGNSVLSLVFALIDGFVLRIGLSRLLGVFFGFGLFGFFLGYGLAAYGTAVPGVIYLFYGAWKKRRLEI